MNIYITDNNIGDEVKEELFSTWGSREGKIYV